MRIRGKTAITTLLICLAVSGSLGLGGSCEAADKPTIYYLDLIYACGMPGLTKYDMRQVSACVQGLVNRDAPRVFIAYYNEDTIWLDRLREPGGLCEGWNVETLNGDSDLVMKFRSFINGVVLYDPDPSTGVLSTSLVATTVAGVEGGVAVRKDTSSGSMYNWLVNDPNGPRLPVLVDLTGKFTGTGTIWQTSTPSTKSRKCDAYIWAKEKYIDTGKCDPTVLLYGLDLYGWSLDRDTQLSNLDYAVSKKGFCFDLSPWGDEKPNDDPTQLLGCDLYTYKSILNACNLQTGKQQMIKVCGFINWDLKYTNWVGGSHGDVATEWEQMRLLTAYNAYSEADAPGPRWLSNASFFAALAPAVKERRYVQNPPPTYSDMVSRGLINGGGQVVAGNYILMGMGDYDQASWTLYSLAGNIYDDSVRGQVYCSWGVDPNAIDRVSVAMDYMYRHKSSKDYFMAWDSGAGYVNPSQLYGARSPSGYPSAVSIWRKHCRDYYRTMDYSISGWLLNGSASLTTTDCSIYAPFSGDGIGTHLPVSFTTPTLVSNVPADSINSGSIIDYSSGVHFGWYRTILETPSQIKAKADSYATSGHNHRFLDAYTYYYLLRYYLGGNNNYRATWIGDTIPRIMETGHTYPVTVTIRNDGWDTWSTATSYALGHAIVGPGVTPSDNDYDHNGRHELPSSVSPGQTVTVSFNLGAPATSGKYDLYYDMARDGVTWFREQNNIEWKKEIIVAVHATDVDTDCDGTPDVTEEANGRLWWNPDDGISAPNNLAWSDTFTRTTLGTTETGRFTWSGAGATIDGSTLKLTAGGTWPDGGFAWLTDFGPADFDITFTIVDGTPLSDQWNALAYRQSAFHTVDLGQGNGYRLIWRNQASGADAVGIWYGGGWAINASVTTGGSHTVRLRVVGNSHKVWWDGAQVINLAHSGKLVSGNFEFIASTGCRLRLDNAYCSVPMLDPGTIAGIVTEVRTGQPVAGVRVLASSGQDTITDANGRYTLNATAGEYTLTLAKFGYKKREVSGVVVKWLRTTTVNVNLDVVGHYSLGPVRVMPSDSDVACDSKIVTAVFAGFFYVEESDRSAGIRVESSEPVSIGDRVNVGGSVGIVDGEKVIYPSTIDVIGTTGVPGFLGVNGKLVGSSYAPDTTGLLVKAWGKVPIGGVQSGYFLLDDGSGLLGGGLKVYNPGKVMAEGHYYSVTGAVGAENIGTNITPVIRTMSVGDIVEH